MKRLAVLISNGGTGTNLQAIIDVIEQKELQAQITVVISDTDQAYGLTRAVNHNIPIAINKDKYKLLPLLQKYNVDYVALAGWKQIITDEVIEAFPNRILNTHPGLIPDSKNGVVMNPDGTPGLWNKGKFTDKAMVSFLENGATYAGCSNHFLTKEFDFGPVLGRCFEKIEATDTIDSLYTRLKQKENALYVEALKKICNGEAMKLYRYALLSVYDKTGIAEFAEILYQLGYKLISTGGTAQTLLESGIPILPIQYITKNPESFDGRMKSISFQIASGILFDRSKLTHVQEAEKLGIIPIDLVVCNLYPFEKTIAHKSIALDEAVEMIDVGGPTMIRAAAKNFKNVTVVVDHTDYQPVAQLLRQKSLTDDVRKKLAAKAFSHLSLYDSQIAHYLNEDQFPQEVTIAGRKFMDLRYGENPHQQAAVYLFPNTPSPFQNLQRLSGRELSLTNITDINAGTESVRLFTEPAAVVIKHNTPCGIALGETIQEALSRAIEADPESAFGGVVILNKPMDKQTAEIIASFKDDRKGNIDIVAAPEVKDTALELLKSIRKTMGIYSFGKLNAMNDERKTMNFKFIRGGFIMQTVDSHIEESFKDWKIVTEKKPTKKQLDQMETGWKFISRVRSNAIIVMDKNLPMTRAIGTGQTSRIRSTKIALDQAGKKVKDAVLISDSFFPFDDSVKLAAEYGIGVIVQQGGSVNDKASIEAVNKYGIPMVFTGRRAFWH